ncbi:MAG: fumarylacetoacetate hydrolase family protein [Planctomycetota bacterium]
MHLAKYINAAGLPSIGLVREGNLVELTSDSPTTLFEILDSPNPRATVESMAEGSATPLVDAKLLAPIDSQEVWAAGVTYKRSQTARMEESEAAASCYDRVYVADRPELFMKATPHRVVGPGAPVRIRKDSKWNVPEPEFTLVVNSRMEIVAYTIGNDMSSRDIEGENPLYLPQAKVYDDCCSLGPWVTLADDFANRSETTISVQVERGGSVEFEGNTSLAQMARDLEDLVGWLGRDTSFPNGAFLLTGTGIVPDSDFTLHPDDVVTIAISGIGELSNPVVQG